MSFPLSHASVSASIAIRKAVYKFINLGPSRTCSEDDSFAFSGNGKYEETQRLTALVVVVFVRSPKQGCKYAKMLHEKQKIKPSWNMSQMMNVCSRFGYCCFLADMRWWKCRTNVTPFGKNGIVSGPAGADGRRRFNGEKLPFWKGEIPKISHNFACKTGLRKICLQCCKFKHCLWTLFLSQA